MITLTFINSEGTEFVISNKFPNILIGTPDGIHSNNVTTQTQKAYAQNGTNYYGSLDDERIINMTVNFNFSTTLEGKEKIREIQTIFNPRLGLGTLVYEDEFVKYKIEAVAAQKPRIYDIEGVPRVKSFDLILLCPDPDWLSFTSIQEYLQGTTGGLIFPITFPITFGTVGGAGVIEHDGDNPANILFDFRPITGTITDPRVVNELGEYIELDYTILSGEKILIETNPNAPSITHIDSLGVTTNIWTSLVNGSTINMTLHRGTNTFTFSSATGSPELYITYNEHFA